jgi:hypothetical protein
MPVEIVGNTLRVRFDRFGIEDYQLFLRVKSLPEYEIAFDDRDDSYTVTAPARFASLLGVQGPDRVAGLLPWPKHFDEDHDDQIEITEMALRAKRFACWSDCGLGKTLIELEFARQVVHLTGGRVLIFSLNEIVPQFLEMCRQFYGDALPLHRIESRAAMKAWCCEAGPGIAITNYEKMNHGKTDQVVNELRYLAGIVCDESDRLSTGGGKQKWALIKSSKGIEYKLSGTATPAPNETTEFASQAAFLEKMRSDNEIIWTYFVRDPKTHRWTVKAHARKAFFEFMAGWSIYVRDPKRFGWRLKRKDPPKPTVIVHDIAMTEAQRTALEKLSASQHGQKSLADNRSTNTIQRSKLSQIAKGFRYLKSESSKKFERIESLKPGFIAKLAADEVYSGLQTLVWTIFNAESDLLSDELAKLGVPHDLLTGKHSKAQRLDIIDRFVHGKSNILVSRASMLGFGRNFQMCRSMIFSGWNDSYKYYYQAVRRAYRDGQLHSVRVHLPVIEALEGDMLENILHKENQHEAAIAEMETNYIEATRRSRRAA